MNKYKNWSKFSNEELIRAIELLVAPENLMDRQVMVAILEACDFRPEDVKSQLKTGQPLHDSATLSWNFAPVESQKQ